MMSHLRHHFLNNSAASMAWHDLVALRHAAADRRASRDFDNVMPRNISREITWNFVSQSRHRQRFSKRPRNHGLGRRATKPRTRKRFIRERDLHRKIRRTEGEKWGIALPPAVWCRVTRKMARRAIQTFCPSDLPVKIPQGPAP
jgi:hypothetical protein